MNRPHSRWHLLHELEGLVRDHDRARTAIARHIAGQDRGRRFPWTPFARMRRRAAAKALRRHRRTWTMTAHQAGVMLADDPEARAVLVRLIDGSEPAAVPDHFDPVHALLLTALRDHHPRPLADRLSVTEDTTTETEPEDGDAHPKGEVIMKRGRTRAAVRSRNEDRLAKEA